MERENNDEEEIIEKYLEDRENEENEKGDEFNQEEQHKKQYIKEHIMDEYHGDE